MDQHGQSLRRLSGWSPRTLTQDVGGGCTIQQTEQELDWVDLAILSAWMDLNDQSCSMCGRPLPLHNDQEPSDFYAGYRVCPATLTLDEAQLRKSKEPEEIRLKNLGLDPERSRSWFTYTDEEGAPAY